MNNYRKRAALFLTSQGITLFGSSLVQFAAPAAADALLSWGTLRADLMIDIATAVVGIGILSAVAIPFEKREHAPSMWTEMKIGIQYAVKEAFIGRLLLVFGLFIFLCVPAGFLATLFVSRYYKDTYCGEMAEGDFKRLSRQASAYLDSVTFDRIAAVTDEKIMERVREACCAVADVLLQKEQRDGIASETNDGISVTYTTEGSTDEERLYQAVVLYLGNTGLLYRGVE